MDKINDSNFEYMKIWYTITDVKGVTTRSFPVTQTHDSQRYIYEASLPSLSKLSTLTTKVR